METCFSSNRLKECKLQALKLAKEKIFRKSLPATTTTRVEQVTQQAKEEPLQQLQQSATKKATMKIDLGFQLTITQTTSASAMAKTKLQAT